MSKLASIVIVTFNRLNFTKIVLDSLIHNTKYPNYELIILDNNSTDGTIEFLDDLHTQHPEFRIIYHEKNLGKGKAANKGFAMAKGEFIIGIDNDLVVPPYWLSELVHALETVPNVGWLCINLENIQQSGIEFFGPQYERRFGDIIIQETPGVGGQCVAMTRAVYEKLGGYYDDIYYGLEDAEYNVRFRSQGLLTGYLMNVTGYHLGGTLREKELYPEYQEYKLNTINGIQNGDFSLAYTDIAQSTTQWIKPDLSSADGELVKGPGPAVFFIYHGFKHEIPTIEVFDLLNLRWEDVKMVEQSYLDSYPDGAPLTG